MNVQSRFLPGQALIKRLGIILVILVSGACNLFAPSEPLPPTQAPGSLATAPAAAVVTATAAASPTALSSAVPPTSVPPTLAAPIQAPTLAAPIRATAVPARPTQPPAPTQPETMQVKIFLIVTGDNGQSGKLVGCGDSVVPVYNDVPYTKGVLRAALEQLLSAKQQFYGEARYYNALYQSNLRIDDLQIEAGEAIVRLSGQTLLGGACDTPRVIAQIEETALQFSTVQRVSVFLNGKPIREALSQR